MKFVNQMSWIREQVLSENTKKLDEGIKSVALERRTERKLDLQYLGKFNVVLVANAFGFCWRNSPTIYGFLKFVYDRGKIWVSLMSSFNVLSILVLTCFSSKLKALPNARKVIKAI
jgi:hypothetical protein